MIDRETGFECTLVKQYNAADFRPNDVNAEVDTLVREYQLEHGGSYSAALKNVLDARPLLKDLFAFDAGDDENNEAEQEAGEELDRQARSYAAEHRVSYGEALTTVMNLPRNAELKRQYAGV